MSVNPPDPASTYGRVISTLYANPDAWLTQADIYGVLILTHPSTVKQTVVGRLLKLWKAGYVERRGESGGYEYRATEKRPPVRGRKGASARVRTTDVDEEKEQRAAERRVQTRAVQRADILALTNALKAHPGCTESELSKASGVPLGRLRHNLRGMVDGAQVSREKGGPNGATPLYTLLAPELPTIQAPRLTPHAAAALKWLRHRPADTELGMAHTLGLSRDEVKRALAHLDGLGRVTWGGVGHLILWRAVQRAA